MRQPRTKRRRGSDLQQRARNGNFAYLEQIVQRKVQPDSEHQQHDADFRELAGNFDVRDIARGKRPDQDAGQQVANQRRNAHPDCDEAHYEREAQGSSECRDKRKLMGHAAEPGCALLKQSFLSFNH